MKLTIGTASMFRILSKLVQEQMTEHGWAKAALSLASRCDSWTSSRGKKYLHSHAMQDYFVLCAVT